MTYFRTPGLAIASAPGPLFMFGFERAWYVILRHALSTSVGVSMKTPPFTMTSFQSAHARGMKLSKQVYEISNLLEISSDEYH